MVSIFFRKTGKGTCLFLSSDQELSLVPIHQNWTTSRKVDGPSQIVTSLMLGQRWASSFLAKIWSINCRILYDMNKER